MRRFRFGLALLGLAPAIALAQGDSGCRPCLGISSAAPAALLETLREGPEMGDETRFFVAMPLSLDGTATMGSVAAVREAGFAPIAGVRFGSPAPLLEHLEGLEAELVELARVAAAVGPDGWIAVGWEGLEDPDSEPSELAFLLKRAAVAVTGAAPGARVLVGPIRSALLEPLYAEDVAAYLDGVVLASETEVETAATSLAVLDPGEPVGLVGVPWPADATVAAARAAELSRRGAAIVTFAVPDDAETATLAVLARELAGDVSFDPASVPGGVPAWAFVRGEDLSLRVVVESGESATLRFADPQLKAPTLIDLTDGSERSLFSQRRTSDGLELDLPAGAAVRLLRLERMSAAELEGLAQEIEVQDARSMPVEEILRRLQAFEDDQARRLDHFQATRTLHLRFLIGAGAASIEASYEGPYFRQPDGSFDWVWESLFIDGVKWRGEKLPEIPIIQPEKAAARPVEITFTPEYRYRLRGDETVEGRDCWVVEFEPTAVEEGRSLFQGTVWVDRTLYARVRTRAVQVGLTGDVISNEETTVFTPVDELGQPAEWSRESYFLPTRTVGQQLLNVLNAAVPVETESLLTGIRVNGEGFDGDLEAAWSSERTMVRDTERGLRYLVKDEEGARVVQEEIDTDRLFLAGGIFYDESFDYPLPLLGINYLDLDFRDRGSQVNVFFGGALLTANIAEPSLFDSRWDAGANVFGLFVAGEDALYRAGEEVPEEAIENRTSQVSLFLGRPLGSFTKLDLSYTLRRDDYGRADDTAEGFVVPTDTFTHTFGTDLSYSRSGYRLNLSAAYSSRDDWSRWGLPGDPEFDPEQQEYLKWGVTMAKTWWLPKFTKLGVELEYLDGADLDRFSRYDFGIFGEASVAGYPSGLVRADSAKGLHVSYGLNAGQLLRVEVETDAVWATNEVTGLDDELLAGVALQGSITLPWQMFMNFEIGQAVDGPGDGLSARIVFLKLFGSRKKAKREAE